jgi:rRNA maturation RNase YbeY
MVKIKIEGRLPKMFNISKSDLKSAAEFFADCSSKRSHLLFQEVIVILQNDEESEQVHLAINGVQGATDVVTQPYSPMPNEPDGVYGELYVNAQMALRMGSAIGKRWTPEKEILLYIAHGMDHLSGAEDIEYSDRKRMRRRELRWLSCLGMSPFGARPHGTPDFIALRGV